jgi:hypothetical protein
MLDSSIHLLTKARPVQSEPQPSGAHTPCRTDLPSNMKDMIDTGEGLSALCLSSLDGEGMTCTACSSLHKSRRSSHMACCPQGAKACEPCSKLLQACRALGHRLQGCSDVVDTDERIARHLV